MCCAGFSGCKSYIIGKFFFEHYRRVFWFFVKAVHVLHDTIRIFWVWNSDCTSERITEKLIAIVWRHFVPVHIIVFCVLSIIFLEYFSDSARFRKRNVPKLFVLFYKNVRNILCYNVAISFVVLPIFRRDFIVWKVFFLFVFKQSKSDHRTEFCKRHSRKYICAPEFYKREFFKCCCYYFVRRIAKKRWRSWKILKHEVFFIALIMNKTQYL